jgi:hypothetical protein
MVERFLKLIYLNPLCINISISIFIIDVRINFLFINMKTASILKLNYSLGVRLQYYIYRLQKDYGTKFLQAHLLLPLTTIIVNMGRNAWKIIEPNYTSCCEIALLFCCLFFKHFLAYMYKNLGNANCYCTCTCNRLAPFKCYFPVNA